MEKKSQEFGSMMTGLVRVLQLGSWIHCFVFFCLFFALHPSDKTKRISHHSPKENKKQRSGMTQHFVKTWGYHLRYSYGYTAEQLRGTGRTWGFPLPLSSPHLLQTHTRCSHTALSIFCGDWMKHHKHQQTSGTSDTELILRRHPLQWQTWCTRFIARLCQKCLFCVLVLFSCSGLYSRSKKGMLSKLTCDRDCTGNQIRPEQSQC